MTIDFKTATKIVPMVLDVRKPVLFRGRHGIGKSEVVYQIAESRGLKVIERRASQMTEGDLVGLPSIDGDSTTFNPPDWFKEACDNPRLLFLDEVDRAVIEVRQGIFELTDSRKLNGHKLHPESLIFACVNGGEHGAQYQVGEMDPAELDRWTVFDLEPSVEDWLSWANDRVSPILHDFIRQNPDHLEHSGEFEPNVVYPSRRSWVRCNDAADKASLFDEGADLGILYSLATAFVGREAAIELQSFVRNYDRMLTPEDILVHGELSKAANLPPEQHAAMVEKIGNYCKDNDMPQDKVQNMAEYFGILPAEIGMQMWSKFTSVSHKRDLFVDFYNTVLKDGRKVGDIMVGYMGASSEANASQS